MIRARAGSLVLLGITRGNVERLMAGQPIRVSGDDPAIGLPGVTLCIMFGETEDAIAGELRAAGVVDDRTVVEDRRPS
jgi:hypothetical protein